MRTGTCLARAAGFSVNTVSCRDDHRGWSAAESREGYQVVLVHRGRFRRRVGHAVAELDRTQGYVSVPGVEEQFAHPVAGGDVCTWVGVRPDIWLGMTGGTPASPHAIYVDAGIDLAHRRLLAAARGGDVDHAAAEQVLGLVARVAGGGAAEPVRSFADAATVVAAREAITAGHPSAAGLIPLAEHLGVSPYRLSRAFSREVGVSLTRFRNRVRVARALDRIEAGEPDLGGLAADLGFADQAHLCRTVREHLGHTPTALRRLLSPSR